MGIMLVSCKPQCLLTVICTWGGCKLSCWSKITDFTYEPPSESQLMNCIFVCHPGTIPFFLMPILVLCRYSSAIEAGDSHLAAALMGRVQNLAVLQLVALHSPVASNASETAGAGGGNRSDSLVKIHLRSRMILISYCRNQFLG